MNEWYSFKILNISLDVNTKGILEKLLNISRHSRREWFKKKHLGIIFPHKSSQIMLISYIGLLFSLSIKNSPQLFQMVQLSS